MKFFDKLLVYRLSNMASTKYKSLYNKTRYATIIYLFVITLIIPQVMCAPPPHKAVTPSPYYYPVATVNPVERRQPIHRPEESQDMDFYDSPSSSYPSIKSTYFSPSQLLLTLLRTALEVMQKVNKNKTKNGTTKKVLHNNSTQKYVSNKKTKLSNETLKIEEGKEMGLGDFSDETYHDRIDPGMSSSPSEETKVEGRQSRYTDPWEGYYEFLITEGSFKFWSAFQLFTAGLLLYSALAAIYYAKFNPIQPDYDTTYDDYFFGRSLEGDAPMLPPDSATPAPGWLSGLAGMGRATFQRVMDAINMPEDKL